MKKFTKFLFVFLLGATLLITSCKKEIQEVTFTNIPEQMYVNDTFDVEYSEQKNVTVEFKSSNTAVATVSGNKVTAVSAGEFTLISTFTLGKATKEYKHTITVLNIEYTITYNLYGGVLSEDAPSKYNINNLPLTLINPTKEGYLFAGWYTCYDYSCDPITSVVEGTTGDLNLHAKWEKEAVVKSISYQLNGGTNTSDAPTSYVVGVGCDLPVPTKTGYTFLGWSLTKNSTNYITSVSTTEENDLVLYANWEKIPVYSNIKYELNGGSLPTGAATQYEEGKSFTLPVPTKDGYEFLGWSKQANSTSYIKTLPTSTKGEVTVYANWEKLPVYSNISYELNGGTLPTGAATQYEEGKELTLPVPTQEGFKFLGWSTTEGSTTYVKAISATSTGDVKFYANWEEVEVPVVGDPFTVTYELNGGSWSWTTATVSSPANGIDAVSNLPEVFMADFYTYLFENNLLNSSKVSTKIQVNNWADFSKNNGDPVALYNTTSTVKTGAADGYSELFFDSVNGYEAVGGFLGTSPYKEKYANVTKHMIQMTLYRYTTVPVTDKTFKAGAGFVLDGYFYGTQGLLASSKENYAEFNALRAEIPAPGAYVSEGVVGTEIQLSAPVKEGHMFLGWYDNPEFTGEKITSVKAGCTLYAYWYNLNAPAPTFTISYELNGGTNASNAPTSYTQGNTTTLPKPTLSGYTFVGWSTDEEGTNIITKISSTTHGNITLYAQWIEGEDTIYSITYNYTDGKLPTRTPNSLQETIEYVLTSYYNWLKPSDDYETFKTKVTSDWVNNKNQNTYKFYKQSGKDTIDAGYFVNAPENFEEWNAWFTVFDAQVTAANGAQEAWNSYVGILRLGQWLSNSSPTTWKDSMNQALIQATQIKIPLITEYKLGDSFDLVELVIDDGRTFLGWYDQNGNKVEKITPSTQGNLVLTAKWSESVPVESFEVTNQIDKLLKFSTHQLRWVITPDNATMKTVKFASSDTSVLTVSEKGLIEAVSVGTAKVLITVLGNQELNMEIEIEVYVDPYIDGEFADNSYLVKGESMELNATLIGSNGNLVWTSKTPSIATVDADGTVSALNEGLAEIVVTDSTNSKVSFTFYITVLDSAPTGILKLLLESNNKEVYTENNLLIGIKIGSDGAYYSDIVGSVSKLLFEDYVVHTDYYLENPSNKTSFSSGGVEFITVHYAADMPYSASAMYNGGKNLASYNKSCNTSGTQASWHYSTGNDGIWACQTEAYGAWHAGSSKTMTWTDSGVTTAQIGTDIYPTDVTLGSDGYFYIKGVKTTIKNTTSSSKLNGMGLGVKLVGNTWYLGGHYFNSSYQYISSTGGNNNSISMETSVREGSDLWLTWQYTAQLCAKLLLKYNLPLNRLVGHHFFSGKWCPQPMLENNLEIWKEFVELTRQEMELYQNYADYKLSFATESSYLKDNGRVKELPDYPECVTYTVTYTTGSTTKTITLSSILPGILE